MGGSLLNYLARATLAVVAPLLLLELHAGPKQYSWIVGAFQIGLLLQPVCGYVLDRIGLKWGFALFATAWSLLGMAHGWVTSWPELAALRAVMGLAEGVVNPAGMKVIARWFPAHERGFAGGVFNLGASFGTLVAAPLVTAAMLAYSWRAAFMLTGGLGLLWVGVWLRFYRDRGPVERRARVPVLGILRDRNFWGIGLPRLLADPTWGTLTFWLPLYLANERHFDLKQVAMFAWLPFLAADCGCLFGGTLSWWLQKRGGLSLINARRTAFTAGAILMTGIAAVGFVSSPYTAVALLSLAGFAHQTLSVTVITMASDLFPQQSVGTVAGMAGTLVNAGLMSFSLLLGAFVARIGYTPFFACLGGLDLCGAILLWTLVRPRSANLSYGNDPQSYSAGLQS